LNAREGYGKITHMCDICKNQIITAVIEGFTSEGMGVAGSAAAPFSYMARFPRNLAAQDYQGHKNGGLRAGSGMPCLIIFACRTRMPVL
jgi:hypothetical protein